MEKDGYIVSPVWINDNLIDLTVTPGRRGVEGHGRLAAADRRASRSSPMSRPSPRASRMTVAVSSPRPGVIAVSGNIPAGREPLVQAHQVSDPPAFARTLLIEALEAARGRGRCPAARPQSRRRASGEGQLSRRRRGREAGLAAFLGEHQADLQGQPQPACRFAGFPARAEERAKRASTTAWPRSASSSKKRGIDPDAGVAERRARQRIYRSVQPADGRRPCSARRPASRDCAALSPRAADPRRRRLGKGHGTCQQPHRGQGVPEVGNDGRGRQHEPARDRS